MFIPISCRMATVNEDENAVPTDLASISSDSNTMMETRNEDENKWAEMTKQMKWKTVKPTHL